MNRLYITLLLAVAFLPMQAGNWTKDQVAEVITKVNTYWQTNNKAEVRSF